MGLLIGDLLNELLFDFDPDAPNAIPSANSSTGYGNSSSSIWSMNCTSGTLYANWVNASGVAIPLEPVNFAAAVRIISLKSSVIYVFNVLVKFNSS